MSEWMLLEPPGRLYSNSAFPAQTSPRLSPPHFPFECLIRVFRPATGTPAPDPHPWHPRRHRAGRRPADLPQLWAQFDFSEMFPERPLPAAGRPASPAGCSGFCRIGLQALQSPLPCPRAPLAPETVPCARWQKALQQRVSRRRLGWAGSPLVGTGPPSKNQQIPPLWEGFPTSFKGVSSLAPRSWA